MELTKKMINLVEDVRSAIQEGKEVNIASCQSCEGAGQKEIQCPFCEGSGRVRESCPDCDGGGWVKVSPTRELMEKD